MFVTLRSKFPFTLCPYIYIYLYFLESGSLRRCSASNRSIKGYYNTSKMTRTCSRRILRGILPSNGEMWVSSIEPTSLSVCRVAWNQGEGALLEGHRRRGRRCPSCLIFYRNTFTLSQPSTEGHRTSNPFCLAILWANQTPHSTKRVEHRQKFGRWRVALTFPKGVAVGACAQTGGRRRRRTRRAKGLRSSELVCDS